MIQETSRQSYKKLQIVIGHMQMLVLEGVAQHGPVNNRELARKLDLSINQVTGRMRELFKKGFIKSVYKEKDWLTDRTVNHWDITKKGIQALNN